MGACSAFLKRKNIVLSAKRYGVDALGAMAQGLFCSLLIGTILDTLGKQLGIAFLVTVGGYASAMSGSAMAVAIGYALQAPPLVLFSLATVGYAANALGSVTLSGGKGAGGPLAVLFIAVIAAELGKAVSKETKIDILVTPLVTILAGWDCPPCWPRPSAPRPPLWGTLSSGPPCSSPSGWGFWCRWSSAWPLLCPSRRPPSAPPSA